MFQIKQGKVGRPKIFDDDSFVFEQINSIIDQASVETGAQSRRQDETIRVATSISSLTTQFNEINKEKIKEQTGKEAISQSYLYCFLAPCKWTSREGHRHIKGATVRFLRTYHDRHECHQDTYYCCSLVSSIQNQITSKIYIDSKYHTICKATWRKSRHYFCR